MTEDNVDLIMEYRDPAYGALVRVYVDKEYDALDEVSDLHNDRDGYTEEEVDEFIGNAEFENHEIERGEKHAIYITVECLDGRPRDGADGVVVDSLDYETLVHTVRQWCHLGDVPILWSEWVGLKNAPNVQHNFVPLEAL